MNNPLHPKWPCDQAVQTTAPILENVLVAKSTRRLRIPCPEIARRIIPGQFVMVRLSDFNDPLLGRALALYNVFPSEGGEPAGIDVVYLVKGKFTSRLAEFPSGQLIDVWGPLGNGFPPAACDHLVMVAGGIGQTPFVAVAAEFLGKATYGEPPGRRCAVGGGKRHVTLCYGARGREYLAGVEDFQRLGVEVRIATDDGSAGRRGLATDLLPEVLGGDSSATRIVCCGPDAMMRRVAEIAREGRTPCHVSLEAPMACGIGACFTCVAMVRDAAGHCDYKRTCVEGPVFDAAQVVWD